MKHFTIISLFTILFSLFTLSASAAVPLRWTVETSRATPAQFEAYQGETLALEAALQSYGKPLEAPSNYSLYWQTNGMGNAWWSTNVSNVSNLSNVSNVSNLLRATWTPSMETGAKVYNCFIGKPGTIYHAAFQLRLRPSPGATPNELPLPQKVIDFAKVTVLNPPWSGGGGGGVNTNAVIDLIHKTVDGSARPLPKYLHALDFDDSYPDAAQEYYRSRGDGKVDGGCSSVRSGGFLSRNFDYPFDERSEFIVRVSSRGISTGEAAAKRSLEWCDIPVAEKRYASVGVAQVGTNLTEQMVTSGKPSRWYKALPGATVDGINENGVACNINVVDGDPQTSGWHTTGDLHPLGAIRWVLDHATNAQHGATYIAANIRFPAGWSQNFHYMVADAAETWIVENGETNLVTGATGVPPVGASSPGAMGVQPVGASSPGATGVPPVGASSPGATGVPPVAVLTNFRLYPTRDTSGEGQERYDALVSGANITSQWWTLTYTPSGYRASDLPGITGEDLANLFNYWENNPRESHRGERIGDKVWWQSIHTSIYDISNRVLRVAVQETDDWYVFAVPTGATGVSPVAVREIVEPMIGAATNGLRRVDDMKVYEKRVLILNSLTVDELPITGGGEYDSYTETIIPYDWSSHSIRQVEDGVHYLYDAKGRMVCEFRNGVFDVCYSDDGGPWFNGRDYNEGAWPVLQTREVYVPDGTNTLATSNGVAAAIAANEKTGTSQEIVRALRRGTDSWILRVEYADSADYAHVAGSAYTADSADYADYAYDVDPSYYSGSGHPTTLSGYGIEDGATMDDLAAKQDALPYPTNAIPASVITGLEPPTRPYLRVYDEVRQCWWIGKMVNGVLNWTVED